MNRIRDILSDFHRPEDDRPKGSTEVRELMGLDRLTQQAHAQRVLTLCRLERSGNRIEKAIASAALMLRHELRESRAVRT